MTDGMERDAARMKKKNLARAAGKRGPGRPPRIVAVVECPAAALTAEAHREWMRETLAQNLPAILKRFIEDTSPRVELHFRAVMELLKEEDGGTVAALLRELEEE
jgi:CRP-like cAMP-binding protein